MDWYKKASKFPHRTYKENYSYCGINFTGNISGDYYPATQNEPSEFPEVELIDAQIDDLEGLWDYVDWISEDFDKRVEEELRLRTLHFGNIDEPLFVTINGIRFIIKADGADINSWKIIGADMTNVGDFLGSLPEKFKNRVEEGILNRGDE